MPTLLLAALAALAAAPAADSPVRHTLRYKFKSGETIRWEVMHRARVETTVSGATQTADTQTESVKAWKVKSVAADGTAVFEHVVESVDMRHKLSGRMEQRYNSQRDKTPPPGFESASKMVGVPLSVISLDALGKVVKREHPSVKPAAENEGQITVPLPEEAISVGHAWSFAYDLDVPLNDRTFKKIKTQQTFKLEEVKDNVATIRVATLILSPVNDPAIEAQLIQREAAGTVRFDIAAGRVVEQQMDVDKHVVGFSGQTSSLHYRTRFTEKLRTGADAAKTAAVPPAPDKKTEKK